MKKNNFYINSPVSGITLIALVITIIVLLILAGVSISMLSGENGILTKAQSAKEKTVEASAKERLGLILTEMQMDSYTNNKKMELSQSVADEIKENEGVTESVYSDGKIKVTIDNETYYIDESFNIINSGLIASKLNVEVSDNACLKITSANPSEYAKENGLKEVAQVASTGVTTLSTISSNIVTIITPDNDVYELDLSDENDAVEYWAYKSQDYIFSLKDNQGNVDQLNVNVKIPTTSEEYFDINGMRVQNVTLKDYKSYYYWNNGGGQNGGDPFPVSTINLTEERTGVNYYFDGDILCINGINTIIFPIGTEKITKGSGNLKGNDIKTIYIPMYGASIEANVFSGLTESTRIYFAAPEPPESWEEGWNNNCSAKMYWGR